MPSIKYPCWMEFSDSGRIVKIVHKDGTILAELLVHGPFARICSAAHDGNKRPDNGFNQELARTFRGELWGLAAYEYLDKNLEVIVDKIG